ncbi:tape measure protein [Ohtaekwangia kribbensis]|uniref:Tape measure protein n=1 Tax=Ohtaekwangia kribbensis TaxID=688913 RepID=A0ABW3JWX2_9BACT
MKVYEYIIRLKDQASQALRKLANGSSQARSGLNNLTNSARKSQGVFKQLANEWDLMSVIGGRLANILGATALAGSLLLLGQRAITLAADLEQTKVGFEVMLGSAQKADTMISQLRSFAKVTPFETTDLVKATETMLGFGIAGHKVMPTLKMLGDVSRGNAEKLRLITLAYSQIQAAGKLTGQDLLQLINAGFNPLQEISAKTGISLAVLKKRMEDGAISAKMIEEAFQSATSKGGRFFGMMDRQSRTFWGVLSTVRDEFNEFLTDLGNKALPEAMSLLNRTRTILSDIATKVDFGPLIKSFQDFFNAMDSAFGVLRELYALLGFNTTQANAMQIAFNGLALAMRVATAPIRYILTAFRFMIQLGKTLVEVFSGVGKVLAGVFTRDLSLIYDGLQTAKNGLNMGADLVKSVGDFVKNEYEGYKGIFTTGNKPDPLEIVAPKGGKTVVEKNGASGGGADLSKLDNGLNKIAAGGKQSVNVTINLQNLIGTQNFDVKNIKESVRDMEKMTIEALLRVINSANYAAQQ